MQYTALYVPSLVRELGIFFERRVASKGLEFITDIEEEFPPALILDGVRLRQVLLNLLGNAVKFTDSGCVRLGVRFEWHNTGIRSRAKVTFEVEDSGIGIPPEMHQSIFDPFEQAKGHKAGAIGGTTFRVQGFGVFHDHTHATRNAFFLSRHLEGG